MNIGRSSSIDRQASQPHATATFHAQAKQHDLHSTTAGGWTQCAPRRFSHFAGTVDVDVAERAPTHPGKSRLLPGPCPLQTHLTDPPLAQQQRVFPTPRFVGPVQRRRAPPLISFLATLAAHHCNVVPSLLPRRSRRCPDHRQIAVAKILLLPQSVVRQVKVICRVA